MLMMDCPFTARIRSPTFSFPHRQQQLTDDGGVLRSVQGADDDEAKALVVLAVNNHVTGLQGGPLWRRGGSRDHDRLRARSRGRIAARRAVLCGHRAGAAAIHRTQLTWRRGSKRRDRMRLEADVTVKHSPRLLVKVIGVRFVKIEALGGVGHRRAMLWLVWERGPSWQDWAGQVCLGAAMWIPLVNHQMADAGAARSEELESQCHNI
ncbi:hypothetical protein EYF80_018855 [Liparis tanakae]|uniref:Uncharacterized protein n=1 Tax=Liparis tanakae TaxID=230148 RepID=A0A4Z2HZA6_9TELE|nr:hypothetical protein EYF80_018855 [Liparis tanakae]